MALRMIEIITPAANLDQLTKLLEEEEAYGV